MSYSMWTPRDVELMTTAWRYGNTMDEIANDLFQGRFTRAAIAGKIFRLGLKRGLRQQKVRVYHETVKARPPRLPRKKARLRAHVECLRLPLHLLGANACRWPVSVDENDEHLLCGLAGYPYCPHHAARSIARGRGRPPAWARERV